MRPVDRLQPVCPGGDEYDFLHAPPRIEIGRRRTHLFLHIGDGRLKIMANMDIAEKRVPQDGRIPMKVEGKEIDLRVSSLP